MGNVDQVQTVLYRAVFRTCIFELVVDAKAIYARQIIKIRLG